MQLTPFNSFTLLSTVSGSDGVGKLEDPVSPAGEFPANKKFSESDDILDDASTAGTDTEPDDICERPQSCKGDVCNDENEIVSDNDDFEEDCGSSVHEQFFPGSDTSGSSALLFCTSEKRKTHYFARLCLCN
ncbi:unnamed protein product [Gongylonema pulchrum]|uniref:Uncharacterized protein n=1 Tax=Gongylonema pulchrum TaxID=637853 RepID=A0A183DE70_9BILA|nr:unnamed protein product [Gongylonema pulchrum]